MAKKFDKLTGAAHHTWNLKHLFDGDDDPRVEEQKKSIQKRSSAFIRAWKERKDYLKDPAVLAQALDEYQRWMRECGTDGNPGYYFWLRLQPDRNQSRAQSQI